MTEHVANDLLQMFVDNALEEGERGAVERHLSACVRCREIFNELRLLDQTFREAPVERLDTSFTRNVLSALNIVPKTPFWFRAIEHLAYVFGLMIVLGVMLTAFLITGVVKTEDVTEAQSFLNNASSAFGEQMKFLTTGLTEGVQQYLPFLFAHGSFKIALMGTVVIGMLALLDRVLKRRYHVE